MIKSLFMKENVITENSDEARELYNQSRFGRLLDDGRVELSLLEAVFLVQSAKLQVFDARNKEMIMDNLVRKAQKQESKFRIRYAVFADLRKRGYVVKTALKFGADFRVYDRGVKPGEAHAKWVVYPVFESDVMTWHEFSAKNRVAHSTRKKLLLGVVDNEGDVSYWEVRWTRP